MSEVGTDKIIQTTISDEPKPGSTSDKPKPGPTSDKSELDIANAALLLADPKP